MNQTDYAQQHAEATHRVTESWNRPITAGTVGRQAEARATEQGAKSDALKRSADYYRDAPTRGGAA